MREQEGERVGLRMLGMSIVLARASALLFLKFLGTAGGGGLTKPSKCFSGNFLALFTLNLSASPLPTSTSLRSEGTDTSPVAYKLIKGDVIDPVVSGVWDRRFSKCLFPLCSPAVSTAFSPFAALSWMRNIRTLKLWSFTFNDWTSLFTGHDALNPTVSHQGKKR